MHETCCPPYTIRLEASRFRPTKTQRNVQNRMLRYTGEIPNPPPTPTAPVSKSKEPPAEEIHIVSKLQEALRMAVVQAGQTAEWDLGGFNLSSVRIQRSQGKKKDISSNSSSSSSTNSSLSAAATVGHGGNYASPVALQLNSHFRRAKGRQQQQQQQQEVAQPMDIAMAIQSCLPIDTSLVVPEVAPNGFINFKVSAQYATVTGFVPLKDPLLVPMKDGGRDEDDGSNMVMDDQGHSLVVTTEIPQVTEEVFDLYKKYQVAVHGDDPEEVTK